MKQFYFFYTRFFDPFVVLCETYLLIFFKFGSFPQDFYLFLFLATINLIIPIVYFLKLLKERQVSNWDVTNKSQRRKIFGPLTIFAIISTVILFILSDKSRPMTTYLVQLQLAGIILFAYLFLVSPHIKSSGHVGVMSVIFIFLLKIYGFSVSWFIILIVLQALARVCLKKHTRSEVIAGFFSGIIIGLIATNLTL
jgi:hypothetical protein